MIRDVAFFSERGIREMNQDAIYAAAEKGRGIFVVADGMGGHTGGEIASSMIVNGIRNWWGSNKFTDAETSMNAVAEQCNMLLCNMNREVFSWFSARGQLGGSTVVVLIVWDDRYVVLSAGDSRIYRARDKTLEQLTTDDVWENLPEVKYEMSNEKVVCDSRYGRLTEALGSEERLKINRQVGVLSGKECFLLCSDGVYKYCAHEELERIMCRGSAFRGAAGKTDRIRKCVARNGADDNYSAVVCCVGKPLVG